MKFDSNRAWQQALAAIRANRELVFALAGVFFLLPSLAFSLLFPQGSPPAGADQAVMMRYLSDYYARSLPYAVPVAILQGAGMLAVITLLTDRSRPTVGGALRTGFAALLPFIAAQLLLGLALGLVVTGVATLAGVSGSPVLAVVGVAGLIFAGLYVYTRLALTAPVIVVERQRRPVAAMRRSWALTRGNAGSIFLFFALILLVFTIVVSITLALLGIVLALLLPVKIATIIAAIVSSALGAGMAVVLVAALAATHGQLAGEPAEMLSATFD